MFRLCFHPKKLLVEVAETFLCLYRADPDRCTEEILKDGRYFKPTIFMKAARILQRENMIQSAHLEEFNGLAQRLHTLASEKEEVDAALADAPDEFLDPLTQEVMQDPVQLPSGNIVDHKTIVIHLANQPYDPFSRQPLTTKDVVPQPELKKKISDWLEKRFKDKE
eukprot:Platyproteum_vivax@DN6034_c0_g1_i3.p1